MAVPPDADLMSSIIPLLVDADRKTPAWVAFQVDQDEDFVKAVRWMITHATSPFTKRDGNRSRNGIVIEWRTREGTWTTKGSSPALRNPAGERYGRLRFRTPQTNPNKQYG